MILPKQNFSWLERLLCSWLPNIKKLTKFPNSLKWLDFALKFTPSSNSWRWKQIFSGIWTLISSSTTVTSSLNPCITSKRARKNTSASRGTSSNSHCSNSAHTNIDQAFWPLPPSTSQTNWKRNQNHGVWLCKNKLDILNKSLDPVQKISSWS